MKIKVLFLILVLTTPLVANADNLKQEGDMLAAMEPNVAVGYLPSDPAQAGVLLASMDPTKAGALLAAMEPAQAGTLLATMNSTKTALITNAMITPSPSGAETVAKILATMSNTATSTTRSTPSSILYAMGSKNAGKVADAFEHIVDSLAKTDNLSAADKSAMNDAIASAINKLKHSIPPLPTASTSDNPATTNIYVQFVANIQAAIQNGQVGVGPNKLSKADINKALTEIGLATGCPVSLSSPSTPTTCH